MKKRLLSVFMSLMMICSFGVYLPNKVIMNLSASAITQSEFDSKLSSLRSTYPNYSTWNDRFDGGTQCFGFARLIAYNVFGSHVPSWTKLYSISEVKAGDVVQYGNTMGSGHTIFVTSVSGDTITFVDCNGNGNYSGGSKVRSCGIKWDNTISKSAMMFGMYSFAYLYSSPSKEPSNHSPVGYVDLVEGGEGSIHVRGWVYDPDSSSQSLEVHVYIGGNVGENSIITRQTGVMANQYREDVNSTFGITGNHGFDQWIETTARGSQPVYIHVVDANDSNGNTAVRRDNQFCFTVNINENIVPVIESPNVSYLPSDGCVKLTWSEIKGAEKYAVCGYVNNRWQKLADGDGTSYTLRNLKAGTNYRVAVIVMINGKWKQDFSNAITITTNEAKISKYPIVTSEVSGNQFRLKWSPVDGAEKYGIAVFLSGKWKVQDYMPGNSSTYTSKKIPSGTYKAVLCAKVNGEWDLSNINSRAFEIEIK